jgi:hypothetical protein
MLAVVPALAEVVWLPVVPVSKDVWPVVWPPVVLASMELVWLKVVPPDTPWVVGLSCLAGVPCLAGVGCRRLAEELRGAAETLER